MAIRTGDASAKHAALDERPVLIDLTQELPIGVIQSRVEEGRHVRVEEGAPRWVGVDNGTPPGVAAGTCLHPSSRARRPAPRRDTALRILYNPVPCAPPEAHHQARHAGRGSWCVGWARLRPRYVGRARPVAGLARHHDLGPLCGI